MTPRKFWFKDKMVASSQANVNIMSPTAQFGINVFEGVRGYLSEDKNEILLFRVHSHIDRLQQSARLIGFDLIPNHDQILDAISETITANRYTTDVSLRVILFLDGEGSWSSRSTPKLAIAPIENPRKDPSSWATIRATISSWSRINDNALPPRVKAGANYLNGRYAHLDALKKGFDAPILLDEKGKVSEGAGACIFVVRNGKLITPPTTSSILESVTRSTVIEIAKSIDVPIEIREVDRTEALIADELFFAGTAAEITPIGELDHFKIGAGTPGKITTQLMDSYLSCVSGGMSQHHNWTTPIAAHI